MIDPATRRLWTANNRLIDAPALGDGGYVLAARAQQIRNALFARNHFTERYLLKIQLDDRAILLERWWRLLRRVVEHSDDPALQRLEAASRHWDGHAAIDSASYRIVREFRDKTLDAIQAGLIAPARSALGDRYLAPQPAQFEGVAWPLLEQRPPASAATALPRLERPAHPGRKWAGSSAGRTSAGRDREPLGAAQYRRDLPSTCTRTARRGQTMAVHAGRCPATATCRACKIRHSAPHSAMVVSPGHENDGIVQTPGGQSGHPLSPFWGAGHDDSVQGHVTAFLPGPARHTLTLRPR